MLKERKMLQKDLKNSFSCSLENCMTESQNHRNAEAGRYLLRTCNPTALIKQGHPKKANQDCLLSISKDRDSITSQETILRVKHFNFKQCFLYFSLCPLSLALSLDTTEKSLAPHSFLSPVTYFYTLVKSP